MKFVYITEKDDGLQFCSWYLHRYEKGRRERVKTKMVLSTEKRMIKQFLFVRKLFGVKGIIQTRMIGRFANNKSPSAKLWE